VLLAVHEVERTSLSKLSKKKNLLLEKTAAKLKAFLLIRVGCTNSTSAETQKKSLIIYIEKHRKLVATF
jgi:hypothetical protein